MTPNNAKNRGSQIGRERFRLSDKFLETFAGPSITSSIANSPSS